MRSASWLMTFSVALSGAAAAQAPAAPPSAVTVGFMHAIHATNNLDETLAFYTDVFGLAGEARPFDNAAVPILTNSPGVKLRVAMLRLPGQGFNFELTEFTNVARTPAQPEIVDPGAPRMVFLVRDLAPVVAALERRKTPIVTRGGKPVRVTSPAGPAEAIIFRDPDGYLVETLTQTPAPDAPAGNVLGAIMGLTVGNLDESLKFWHDQLGFEFASPPALASDGAMLDLLGLPRSASYRLVFGVVPGSNARLGLLDVEGVPPGKPFDLRVPDPGASGMAIRVAAIEQLVPHLKSAGVRVISKDGALVEWSETVRNVFVKDPNGLNIELVGAKAP